MAFSEYKVTQMAAFFLQKEGGSMALLKLMKLLYLSEREALDRYDGMMSGDRMVAMPHGPVLSKTLDLINGFQRDQSSVWAKWISDRANHYVSLMPSVAQIAPDELFELSDADVEILEAVWQRFGGMDQFQLRDWTHDNCEEWEDPRGSSYAIEYHDVFRALGRSDRDANEAAEHLRDQDAAFSVLAKY